MANKEIRKMGDEALHRLQENGIKTITALQLQQFLEIGDTPARKIFDYYCESWKIGDQLGSLIVPPIKKEPKPRNKKYDSDLVLLKANRNKAIAKILDGFLDDTIKDASLIAAALRCLPPDSASEEEIARYATQEREGFYSDLRAELGLLGWEPKQIKELEERLRAKQVARLNNR